MCYPFRQTSCLRIVKQCSRLMMWKLSEWWHRQTFTTYAISVSCLELAAEVVTRDVSSPFPSGQIFFISELERPMKHRQSINKETVCDDKPNSTSRELGMVNVGTNRLDAMAQALGISWSSEYVLHQKQMREDKIALFCIHIVKDSFWASEYWHETSPLLMHYQINK